MTIVTALLTACSGFLLAVLMQSANEDIQRVKTSQNGDINTPRAHLSDLYDATAVGG